MTGRGARLPARHHRYQLDVVPIVERFVQRDRAVVSDRNPCVEVQTKCLDRILSFRSVIQREGLDTLANREQTYFHSHLSPRGLTASDTLNGFGCVQPPSRPCDIRLRGTTPDGD